MSMLPLAGLSKGSVSSEPNAEFLYAWPGNGDGLGTKSNTKETNSSVVLRLQYREHAFIFMGDAEGKDREDDRDPPRYVEKSLLDTVPEKLEATVLKIAHHGSETSSTTTFISAVDPEIVVVQSGRHSFSGTFLPDVTTLQRYCGHNDSIKIYRTDQGDVWALRATSEEGLWRRLKRLLDSAVD